MAHASNKVSFQSRTIMRLLKILLLSAFPGLLATSANGQPSNIIGSWQLVKQGNCMQETGTEEGQGESLEELRKQMKSRTPVTAQIVVFKKNLSGSESSRMLNMARNANPKKFYYKFNGNMLLILDKKSQTISDSYTIEKFTADSLIVSHARRPCETRIFVKITEDRTN